MKQEIIPAGRSLPGTRLARAKRVGKIALYAGVGIVALKVALVVLSVVMSLAMFALVSAAVVGAAVYIFRR